MLWGYHFVRLMCIILRFLEICIGKNLEGARCVQRNHKLTVTVKFYGSRMWQYPLIKENNIAKVEGNFLDPVCSCGLWVRMVYVFG